MGFFHSELAGIASDRAAALQRQAAHDAEQSAQISSKALKTTLETLAGVQSLRKSLESVVRTTWPDHPYFRDSNLKDRIYEAGQKTWAITRDWDAVLETGTTFSVPDFDFSKAFEGHFKEKYEAKYEPLVAIGQQAAVWKMHYDALVPKLEAERDSLKAKVERLEAELAQIRETLEMMRNNRDELAAVAQNNLDVAEELKGQVIAAIQEIQSANRDCVSHMALQVASRAALETYAPGHPLVADADFRVRLTELAFEQYVKFAHDFMVVKEFARTFISRQESARLVGSSDVPHAERAPAVDDTFDEQRQGQRAGQFDEDHEVGSHREADADAASGAGDRPRDDAASHESGPSGAD